MSLTSRSLSSQAFSGVNEKSWSSIRLGTTPLVIAAISFLTQRHERDDAEVDRVAAGLLVIRDELAQRHVLALNKALAKPCRCRRGRGVGDIGARQRSRRDKARRTTQHRPPAKLFRLSFLPLGADPSYYFV